MKIAVCMHGFSGNWDMCVDSIKSFLLADNTNELFFFGHTWSTKDANSLKWLDASALNYDARVAYGFVNLLIEDIFPPVDNYKEFTHTGKTPFEETALYVKPHPYDSTPYSAMRSNFLKQKYELDNNMKFDLVISLGWDQMFDPTKTFAGNCPEAIRGTIHCEVSMKPSEFHLHSINDKFYYGISESMDLVDTFYRAYHTGSIFKILDANYHDAAYKTVSYGTLLYKWVLTKNLYPGHIGKLVLDEIVKEGV